jgi:hypothetical protein
LDCVIGEVNQRVESIFQGEGVTAGADVTIFVPVGFEVALDTGEEKVVAKVEFAVVVEEGFMEIGLDDVGEGKSIFVFGFGE